MRLLAIALPITTTTAIQAADYTVSEWLTGMLFLFGLLILFAVLPMVVVFFVLPTLVARELPIEELRHRRREALSHPVHRSILGGLIGAIVGLGIIIALVIPWSPAHDWVMGFEGGFGAVSLALFLIILPILTITLFSVWFRRRQH